LSQEAGRPLRLIDPDSKRESVCLPAEIYERLTAGTYDDSPWTNEERAALAAQAGLAIGWGEMDGYDNYPDALK